MEAKHEACSDDNGLQVGEGLGTGGKLLRSRGEDPRAVRGTDQQLPGCGAKEVCSEWAGTGTVEELFPPAITGLAAFCGASLGITGRHWATLGITGLY